MSNSADVSIVAPSADFSRASFLEVKVLNNLEEYSVTD